MTAARPIQHGRFACRAFLPGVADAGPAASVPVSSPVGTAAARRWVNIVSPRSFSEMAARALARRLHSVREALRIDCTCPGAFTSRRGLFFWAPA